MIGLPSLHDDSAVEAFRRRWRIDPNQIRLMRHAFYQQHEPLDQALARLRIPVDKTRSEFQIEPLAVLSRHDSTQDGSSKLVLEAKDGARIESVLIRAKTGRTTVCVSTQVGCQAGCTFCATARMGLLRNLTAVEMIEQVLIAGRLAKVEGRRLRNVVLMGMGEPLHNEAEVYALLDRLLSPSGCRMPPRRITVSTVGVPDAMVRLVDRYPAIQLAVSLHSARPEIRGKLVPWSRRYSWDALRDALRYCNQRLVRHREQGPVMIEHLLLDGVNDSDGDAEVLVEYLAGIPAHVNLIPYNPIAGITQWQPSDRERREAFATILRSAGIFTTVRYSMGTDVQAACGQLVIGPK